MNLPFLGMTPLAGTEGHRALTGHGMVRSRGIGLCRCSTAGRTSPSRRCTTG